MTFAPRWAAAALLVVLAAALLVGLSEFVGWRHDVWPVLRAWPDRLAQDRAQWGAALADTLAGADAALPRQAVLLLVTPGADWRRVDYVVYHRALYVLAPRPLVWAAPFAADGTWEGRWHVPTALSPEALTAVARAAGARCLLAWNVPAAALPGQVVQRWPGGALATLDTAGACGGAALPPAAAEPPLWRAAGRALLGALLVAWLGAAGLPLLARLGLAPGPAEAAALSWVMGALAVSTALFWLTALGLSLNAGVVALSVLAVPLGAWGGAVWWRRWRALPQPPAAAARPPRAAWVRRLLLVVVAGQVAVVLVTALGRPLAVWDSWVSWGMQSRRLFLAQTGPQALLADPTRLLTHPGYPLMVPLLQAWEYAWLGRPDDRWAGLPVAGFYLALLLALPAGLRRLGVRPAWAWVTTAAAACLPGLTRSVGAVYPDAVLTALAALAALYLLAWDAQANRAYLFAAGLCAGLLPWTKQEGWLLAGALLFAALALAWRRGASRHRLAAALTFTIPVVVLAGPWAVLVWRARLPPTDFAAVAWATYWQQSGRLLSVAWRALRTALEPRLAGVWLAALGVAAGLAWRRPRRLASPAALVGLGVPLVYLAALAQAYVFSNYAPFQAHVTASWERLMVPVTLLPMLWLALATRQPPAEPMP
ncbi:MAG: hypothetical protein IT317_18010 [Anaerolineales bacterium]|nr:hypothetical protein [Anaerolineales bacterium]